MIYKQKKINHTADCPESSPDAAAAGASARLRPSSIIIGSARADASGQAAQAREGRKNAPQEQHKAAKHLAVWQIIAYFAPLSRNRCQERELLGMLRTYEQQFRFVLPGYKEM